MRLEGQGVAISTTAFMLPRFFAGAHTVLMRTEHCTESALQFSALSTQCKSNPSALSALSTQCSERV